jgi:hypothetical protein
MKALTTIILTFILVFNYLGCSKEYVGIYRSKQFLQNNIIEIKSNGEFEYISNDKSLCSGVIVEKSGILTLKLEDGSELGEFKYDKNKLTSIKQVKGGSFDFEIFAKGQVFMREEKN